MFSFDSNIRTTRDRHSELTSRNSHKAHSSASVQSHEDCDLGKYLPILILTLKTASPCHARKNRALRTWELYPSHAGMNLLSLSPTFTPQDPCRASHAKATGATPCENRSTSLYLRCLSLSSVGVYLMQGAWASQRRPMTRGSPKPQKI